MALPRIAPADASKPIAYDPQRRKFILFDEIASRRERIVPVDALGEEDLKTLVIERQRAGPDYRIQAISGPPMTRDDVIRAIEQDQPHGRITLQAERSYLRELQRQIEAELK